MGSKDNILHLTLQNKMYWLRGKNVLSQRWLPGKLRDKTALKGISPLGRETSLIPLEWTAEGWPKEKLSRQLLDIANKPNLPFTPVDNKASDEFDTDILGVQWQFRRNPIYQDFSLTERKGFLRIYTGDYDIDTIKGRNLIVQRERWLKYNATTKLFFNSKSSEQAGLTCHYDTKTYVRLGLQNDKKKGRKIILEECNYGKKKVLNEILSIKNKPVYLKVSVDMLKRSFYYSYDNEKWFPAGVVENASFLSDQGTPNWGFMGTMVGVYAFNTGSNKRIPADFDWFRISVN